MRQKVEPQEVLHKDAQMYVEATDPFQCIRQKDAVLEVLAEERLEQFADRVQTRILDGKQAELKSSHAGN